MHRRHVLLLALLPFLLLPAVLLSTDSPGAALVVGGHDDALVILSTLDLASFHETLQLVRTNGGEVPQAYVPNAFVATLNPEVELALGQHPAVARIEKGVVDPASLRGLGGQAETAAHIWNTVFRGVPDPIAAAAPSGPPPEPEGPDFLIPPPEVPGIGTVPGVPSPTQTTEFMAGTVVYSVVFVESSGGTGNCVPADTQTETWSAPRQTTVLSEISDGLNFWTSRSNRPSPLTFVLDNRGSQPTSCEPITRRGGPPGAPNYGAENLWIADVLTAMGFPATTADYYSVARSFANARRTALGADWGFTIFVVDSLNDSDGSFLSGDWSAYAYLNGPFMVMTYDNGGWGISLMNLVTAHETGHTHGAIDEYASSLCSTADSWGYLNVANTSCNNGGDTTDISIMGEGSELVNLSVDVSTSARGAIGWRNPGGTPVVVDVVRTATVFLTPYTPDPTSDTTPTYSASAGNTPFPPEGPRIYGGVNYGTVSPVTVSRVAGAQWNLDGGPFTSNGVVPNDGAFDEESDPYTFTPPSPVSIGPHTFRTRSINNFGHQSSTATDGLTISQPPACIDRLGDTTCDDPVNDPDDDGCTVAEEAALGSVFDSSPAGWYDVYDVPVPAKCDVATGCPFGAQIGANGFRNKMVGIDDVLAVLFYAFADDNGPPNFNTVDYDSIKGVDLDSDTVNDAAYSHEIEEGLKYDRSPGLAPDPITGIDPAGPPNGVIDIGDVLATLAQAFVVDCSGPP